MALGIRQKALVLGLRTDSAEATVILGNPDGSAAGESTWTAGRQLSDQLLTKIEDLLKASDKDWNDLTGLVVYEGPGSFTGLRIGITVANTVAFVLGCPIVGASGDDWFTGGVRKLESAKPGEIVRPEYGAEANISKPKR